MRAWGGALVVVMVSLAAGCADDTLVDGRWDSFQWRYLQTLRRPVLDDPSDDELRRANLGKLLFFDTSYSDPEGGQQRTKMSCATCHRPPWFVDVTPQSQGVLKPTPRNTIALADVAYQDGRFTWSGKYRSLYGVLELPLTKPMHSTYWALAATIASRYRTEYEAAYGAIPEIEPGEPDVVAICDDAGDALATYERQLTTGNAPFDDYVDGHYQYLSESAKHGLELFIGDALCSECHTGANFADGSYHNTGVPQTPDLRTGDYDHGAAAAPDPCDGASADCDPDRLDGAFRTPSLRNVAMTPPYMHAGQLQTLGDVIDFYWRGGGTDEFPGAKDPMLEPLVQLTTQDREDLVAFLESLTSQPVDKAWYQ